MIELSVVIVLVALLASAVAPNLSAMKRSRIEREFPIAALRLALTARETAISDGQSCALMFGDQLRVLQMVRADLESGTDTALAEVSLSPEVETGRLDLAGRESNSSDWRLTFYPDGTCDGGGVEFRRGDRSFALVIDPASGAARIVDGQLPDSSGDRWQAGEIEHHL